MVGTDYAAYLRECEYALITLNSNLKKNDLIDVRIMYTNGENYTILPKNVLRALILIPMRSTFGMTRKT